MANDRGAHFLRTDFQIHSPRDAAWTGHRPIVPEERLAFAKTFVQKCRALNLQAIAVTDHHDICFIKYVQLAAQDLGLEGVNPRTFEPNPLLQNPVVFPGAELTLQVPCQAIVLLDATAGVSMQETLMHLLGITPLHSEDSEQGPPVVRLRFHTLKELDEELRNNTLIRGRYIILPNLNEGGQDTLLRGGCQHQYAEMPCVGGYTEQDFSSFGSGHLNKLNGGDINYGSRAVGMFQTSDCRRSDFQNLACRTTWVKMAEPTAEALRQACLSRGSRLFQTEPTTPRIYISRVEITNSVYLGALDQYLNPQFNAFIGGRGTGKSTFLEFIRWAMQDQPVDVNSETGVDKKRQHFLDTLLEAGGSVRIHWSIDGTTHVVTYDPAHSRIALKVGSDSERESTAEEIRSLLPIRAYSQKQLSSVSGKRSELQRFVEEPIRDCLRQFEGDFEAIRAEIRTHYTNRRKRIDITARLQVEQTKLSSVQERVRSLQTGLKNMPAEAERAMQEHSPRLEEEQFVAQVMDRYENVLVSLDATTTELGSDYNPVLPETDTPQREILGRIHAEAAEHVSRLRHNIDAARSVFRQSYAVTDALMGEWRKNHKDHLDVLTNAQSQQKENAALLSQLNELRKQENASITLIAQLQKALADTPDGEAQLPDAWARWISCHTQRSEALRSQCQHLSHQSANKLNVELHAGRDADGAVQILESKLQGARIHPARWETLKTWLSEEGTTVQRWNTLCRDLLAMIEPPAASSPVPVIPSWDLTDAMRSGIRSVLSFDGWLELATLTIQDVPVFYYTGGGTRILFDRASAGQQATVLLKLLLKDAKGPLLIDQPEDDLDNDVIGEVIEDILVAKQSRQLLFASHNANLVVNGDAELVVRFRTITRDGKSYGKVANEGSIDCAPVREAITEVMEGGRKAFELRRQKYGY